MNSVGCTNTLNLCVLGHFQNGTKQTEKQRFITVAFVTDHVFKFKHCQNLNFPQTVNERFRCRMR